MPEIMTLHVDGKGYAGQVCAFSPPAAFDPDDDTSIASFTLSSYCLDVLSLFGMTAGHDLALTVRCLSEGADVAAARNDHVMRGQIITRTFGGSAQGEKPPLIITMRLDTHVTIQHPEPRAEKKAAAPAPKVKATPGPRVPTT